jgi:transcriptional regulator with XRE-family HTH domain
MNFSVAGIGGLILNFRCVAASVAVNEKRFIGFVKLRKQNLSFVRNISERLEYAIRRSGMSKGALSGLIGVPQSSLSRWLSGSQPRADKLAEIAKFLSVDVKWLTYGEMPENAESVSNVKETEAVYGEITEREQSISEAFTKIREALDILEDVLKQKPRQ